MQVELTEIKTYPLYDGRVNLTFDEEKHLYSIDGRPVPGVTSVIQTIAKPALIRTKSPPT